MKQSSKDLKLVTYTMGSTTLEYKGFALTIISGVSAGSAYIEWKGYSDKYGVIYDDNLLDLTDAIDQWVDGELV